MSATTSKDEGNYWPSLSLTIYNLGIYSHPQIPFHPNFVQLLLIFLNSNHEIENKNDINFIIIY